MKTTTRRKSAACLMLFLTAIPLIAGAQGGPPPFGNGGAPPPPGIGAQLQVWNRWRMSHPNVEAANQTLRGLEDIELGRGGFGNRPGAQAAPNSANRLDSAQARKLLVVLKSWRGKSVMTDAQAKNVNSEMLRLLNPAQKLMIKSDGIGGPRGLGGHGMGGPHPGGQIGSGAPLPSPDGRMMPLPPPRQGSGTGHGPQSGYPSGNFRPGGFAMPKPRDYNPLNPGTSPLVFTRSRAMQRLDTLIARLTAVAK